MKKLEWKRNLPFMMIPPDFITQLSDPWTKEPLSTEDFYEWASWMNLCPNVWNSFCFVNDRIVYVMWGILDPLISEIYIKYAVSDPCTQSYNGLIMKAAFKEMKEIAKSLNLKHIYFISERLAFARKQDSPVKAYPTYLMEVDQHE